jgi:hypothetical protein
VFAEAEQFARFARAISALKREVRQAIEADPVAWSQFADNAFRAEMQQAFGHFKVGAPYLVCPYCGASQSEKCRACRGTGFLSAAQARCVPKELRA